MDARKVLHIRELKRVAHEDRSKFARRPTLSGRYARPLAMGQGRAMRTGRSYGFRVYIGVDVHASFCQDSSVTSVWLEAANSLSDCL